jgi:hypothetical protein
MGLMAMPRGSSPDTAQKYYEYLQGHQESTGRVQSWHVDWMSLAWLWGFAIAMTVLLLLWIWQYRSTRQRGGVYAVDKFGGYTTELAGPATRFFLFLSALLTLFAVALIAGHLIWGQKF